MSILLDNNPDYGMNNDREAKEKVLLQDIANYNFKNYTDDQMEGNSLADYDGRNRTCSECENFCGLTCFPVCLFFQSTDCQIPTVPFNHSGII